MACRTQTLVWCNGCEELIFDSPSSTAAEQRSYAKNQLGWVRRPGGKDYCATCQAEGKAS